jgi:hypothetical protein
MDIVFDHNEWRPAPATRAFAGGLGHVPEWLILQARMSAAWSARQELGAITARAVPRCGSFDRASTRLLAGFENSSHAVNPILLGNGKPDGGNAGHLAGDSTSGGRG